MDTKRIGDITELEVLTYITKLGYQVSVPFGDRERYDQIWDIGGRLLRVQIKTAHGCEDWIRFACSSTHRINGKCAKAKYTTEDVDFFATFWDGKCYIVPVRDGITDVTIRFSTPINGQKKNIRFAKDCEAGIVLHNLLQ